ncbi:MAG TPA: hypothetical protein PLE12_10265 [Propionicimonas sp.]|jgi:hypothetical protein|nr:hypothetical protein [Propionicimonas sp.]
MAYHWVPTPEPDEDVRAELGLDLGFDEQADAERWLTAGYEALAAAGVHAVALYEEGRLVYGPMGLDD